METKCFSGSVPKFKCFRCSVHGKQMSPLCFPRKTKCFRCSVHGKQNVSVVLSPKNQMFPFQFVLVQISSKETEVFHGAQQICSK